MAFFSIFPSFPTDGTYNPTICFSIIFRTNKFGNFRKFAVLWRHKADFFSKNFLLAQNVLCSISNWLIIGTGGRKII